MNGLRSNLYNCRKIFEREQLKIFHNNWIPLSLTQYTDGHQTPFLVGGKDIFLSRNKAFVNSCSHRMTRLVERREEEKKIVRCPYHNWCFKDGELVNSPGYSGDRENLCLKEIKIAESEGVQFSNLLLSGYKNSRSEPNLSEFCSHLEDASFKEYKLVKTQEYKIKANWKHVLENFLDFLHVPAIHPNLAPSSKREDHSDEKCDGHHIAFKTQPMSKSEANPLHLLPLPKEPKLPVDALYFHVLFPSCFIFLHVTHAFFVFVEPISVNETKEVSHLLLNPETAREIDEDTVKNLSNFYDKVNREDVSIVERCQRGTDVGWDRPTNLLLPWDKYIFDFQTMYRSFMEN